MIFASLYAPSNTLNSETLREYFELGPDLFLLGDLNSKTQSVGCRALVSDFNGKALEEILSSELDLCVLNDKSPTYFKFKSNYSELLDLFLCSSKLANILSHFEVLNEDLMGSDHAPISCTLVFNKKFNNIKMRQQNKFGHFD